jgi:hypothetical protein
MHVEISGLDWRQLPVDMTEYRRIRRKVVADDARSSAAHEEETDGNQIRGRHL